MFFIISLSLFFHYSSVTPILVKNFTASSLFTVDGAILNQERNLG